MEPPRRPRRATSPGAPAAGPRSSSAGASVLSWLTAFGQRLGTLATKPTTRVGLIGLALLFTGLSANLGARTPAYYNVDETAHVGYLASISRGHLPEIEDRSTVPQPDPELASRLAAAPPTLKTIWVANHPPGAYLPAVPIVWLTNALGVHSAVPVALRIAGIAFGVAALGFAYLLGREVSDGDERAGLLAAALMGFVPHLAYVSGTGFTDSASLAGGLAVTWMAVRMIRLGFTRHRTYWLAAFVAVAWSTRLTSAVLAVLTVAVLGLLAPRGRAKFLAIAILPAVAVAGWSYLRTQRLYGDPAASEYLLGRFDLQDPTSVPTVFTQGDRWDGIIQGLAFSAPPYRYALDYIWFRLLKVAVIGTVLTVVAAPAVRWLRSDPRPRLSWKRFDDRGTGKVGVCSAAVVGLSIVLPFVFMAQHMAGGGGEHSRYLLPIVPAITAIIARAVFSLPRQAAKITSIVLVALGGILDVQVLRRYQLPQFYADPPKLWTDALLPSTVSTLAATFALVGFVLVMWAMSVPPDTHFLQGSGAPARDAKRSQPPKPAASPVSRR